MFRNEKGLSDGLMEQSVFQVVPNAQNTIKKLQGWDSRGRYGGWSTAAAVGCEGRVKERPGETAKSAGSKI